MIKYCYIKLVAVYIWCKIISRSERGCRDSIVQYDHYVHPFSVLDVLSRSWPKIYMVQVTAPSLHRESLILIALWVSESDLQHEI